MKENILNKFSILKSLSKIFRFFQQKFSLLTIDAYATENDSFECRNHLTSNY